MRKKFVVYFHKLNLAADPFSSYGDKRSVYHDLFRKGIARGHEMYLASGKENSLGNFSFANTFRYNGTSFEPQAEIIQADAVYDRSGGTSFPTEALSRKTLNNRVFKLLCNNKNATKKLLHDFMPKNYVVMSSEELQDRLLEFDTTALAVLKPSKGMCGKGVIIDTPANLASAAIETGVEYALQEFVDTSRGIPGITDTHHDLRIIIVNGEVLLVHVRTPKAGSLLANVAQGGSIREVLLENIPAFIMEAVQKIQKIVDTTFDFPLYSIDFGIQNGDTAFVFELNDQIGFPSDTMTASSAFVEGILDSLELRATL